MTVHVRIVWSRRGRHANGRAGRDAVDPHRHRSAVSSRCLARQRGFKNIAGLALNMKGPGRYPT
jgi:hypothetical protein